MIRTAPAITHQARVGGLIETIDFRALPSKIDMPDFFPLNLSDFVAVHESAFGTKQTSEFSQLISAFGGKADIAQTFENVC